MKSYKCRQCGLTNWTTVEFCKRCQNPNPYFNPNDSFGEAQSFAAAGSYQQNSIPNYSSPPPPNVFGSAAGTASDDYNSQNNYQNNYGNRPPIRGAGNFQSPEIAEQLAAAEKQIRNAWIFGVIICVITALVAVFASAAGNSKNMPLPAAPVEMLFSVVIYGLLTIGVYFKNRGCAIALCALYILDKIAAFALTGKFSGAITAFIFIYYFAYGIQGAFTYQKLKKQGY